LRPDPEDRRNKTFVKVLQALNGYKPALDFAVNLGDTVDQLYLPGHAHPEKYMGDNKKPIPVLDLYNKTIRDNLKFPLYDALGNHEFYWDVMWNTSIKRPQIEKILLDSRKDTGSLPALYYSFDHGDFNMIVLDSVSTATSHTESWLGGFIYKILETYKDTVAAVFFGHGHSFMRDSMYGIPIYMTGDPSETPGYFIIECKSPKFVSVFNDADIKYNTFVK
jgi:hypothetical protein